MSSNSTGPIRGSRVGSGAFRPPSDVAESPRFTHSYYCASGHRTDVVFSTKAANAVPKEWPCQHCSATAGSDLNDLPQEKEFVPFKTHFDYVRERRSESDGEKLLQEALSKLRSRRR